jgi:hypothetical protein
MAEVVSLDERRGQANRTLRENCGKRWAVLKKERDSWLSTWREISDFLLPRRGRFLAGKGKNGAEKNGRIINSRGTLALRTFKSGMMSGATSPARPWFKLGVADHALMESAPVKLWLDEVRRRMLAVFSASNVYGALHQAYEEVGAFGTLCIIIEEDFEDVVRATTLTAGEYAIAENERGQVDTLYREAPFTVRKLIERFGKERCSIAVNQAWTQQRFDDVINIIHAIEPNPDMIEGRAGAKGMPFRSVYYDPADEDPNRVLSFKGYREFPALVARWDLTGPEVYGRSPGMDALPDVRQLQQMEKRKAQGVDKMVNPPMQGPAALRNEMVSLLPGAVTYVSDTDPKGGLRPVYEVNPRIGELSAEIEKVERRIDETFFADLFLMLDRLEGVQPRNTFEIAERKEEKMLVLGPAHERLQGELYGPLIDRAYAIMERAGLIPEAPPELEGQNIEVEYISVLAQAQKSVGITGIERTAAFVGNLAGSRPDVLDKFDADQAVDEYAEIMGVSPKIIVPDEQVDRIRAARLDEKQRAEQMQATMAGVQAAKLLSETPVGAGENALQRVIGA